MMQFVFIDMAGQTLFTRNDAQRALWTVEEYSLELEFPYKPDKVVSVGQRVFFKDPATGAHQIYEVKQAKTYQPDGYQEIVAEHICVSELSDEHMDSMEVNTETASTVLNNVLTGTLWQIGRTDYNPTGSGADLSRGSVWQAILQIKSNWNVYIEPHVALANDGTITRYLDILNPDGVWHGVRLSIDKNMLDPSVTYDDSEVYTALYGYGGTITSSDPDVPNKECTFADVEWASTAQHPAKPMGQTYLLDPVANAEYGRNRRPRFGYYQNNDILEPELLLEKTWEMLKTLSSPKVSVTGSVADLYRLGYADQPLSLHDIALVDILPMGYKKQIQIIRMTVDLLDPTATTLTIGAYIPNIIYISRKTNEEATGSKGGGGRNTADDSGWKEFRTSIQQINNGTALCLQSVHNDVRNQAQEIAIQTGRIDIAYDKITAEVEDRRTEGQILEGRITVEANRITEEVIQRQNGEEVLSSRITVEADRITQEVTNRKNADSQLSSRITQTADKISAEVTRAKGAESSLSGRIDVEADRISLVVSGTGANAHIKPASIVSAINNGSSTIKISADHIVLDGDTVANSLEGKYIGGVNIGAGTLTVEGFTEMSDVECNGLWSYTTIGAANGVEVGTNTATWKSQAVITDISTSGNYGYWAKTGSSGSTTVTGSSAYQKMITDVSVTQKTLYYLGR